MSYTVIITEEVAANIAVTTQNYPITIEYNATNISDGSTYGNANVAGFMASFGSNVISTTGNVTAGNIIANGQYLTNLTAANIVGVVAQATQANTANTATSAGTANVALVANSVAGANVTGVVAQATQANAANTAITVTGAAQANITSVGTLTSLSVTGNVTSGNIVTAGIVYAPQVESAGDLDLNTAGVVNVNGNIRLGDNNTNTQIATHGTGDLILTTHQGDASQGNIRIFDGANGNIAITPNGTGLLTTTSISATGTVTGANIVGDGSGLSNLPGANVTGVVAQATQANTANTATTAGTVTSNAQANITSVGTLTSLTSSGNITGSNLVATANLTSTQQTVIGTANVGTTGNIVISGKNIATDVAFNPDAGTTAAAGAGRVTIGTGWAGNINWSSQATRLTVSDAFSRGNVGSTLRLIQSEPFITLTGNVTNASIRNQAIGGHLRIGGGPAANSTSLVTTAGTVFSVAPGQFNLDIGNAAPFNLGNTTISHAALNGGAIAVAAGSTLTNGYGIFNSVGGVPAGTTGNLVNFVGYTTNLPFQTVPTGNIYAFYHGSNATGTITGAGTNNSVRQAPQYYAFYNADDLAQMQLGSVRRYHEFESPTATSGSFAIDKNVAQVHNIVPTGNCTITGYSNMVVSVSDGISSDAQVDTLTIIVEQGATPYTITLPTGSQFKYAGNVRTVGTTANSVTMISVTAANVGGTTTYLTTVSPEFV